MIPKNKKIKKEGKFQTIFFSIFIGVLLLGTVGFLIFSSLRISHKRTEMAAKIESLEKEIKALEEKKLSLQAGISQSGEESHLEEKAREQGYQKPGEETVVVIRPEEKKEAAEEEKGFWQKLLEKIGF